MLTRREIDIGRGFVHANINVGGTETSRIGVRYTHRVEIRTNIRVDNKSSESKECGRETSGVFNELKGDKHDHVSFNIRVT